MRSKDNEFGSIFDAPDEDAGFDEAVIGHDPMRGPLSSEIPWDRTPVPEIMKRPRTMTSGALPATDDFLLCLAGPCRYYAEWLEEGEFASPQVRTSIERVCAGFGEPAVMGECTRFACTRYAPPLWSLQGLRRRIISAHRLSVARRRLAGRQTPTIRERVIDAAYARVKGDAVELPVPPDQEQKQE